MTRVRRGPSAARTITTSIDLRRSVVFGDMDDSHENTSTRSGQARPTLAVVGACLACCLPMLIVLGAVSIGTALAGGVVLGAVAAIGGGAWIMLRRGGATGHGAEQEQTQPGQPR